MLMSPAVLLVALFTAQPAAPAETFRLITIDGEELQSAAFGVDARARLSLDAAVAARAAALDRLARIIPPQAAVGAGSRPASQPADGWLLYPAAGGRISGTPVRAPAARPTTISILSDAGPQLELPITAVAAIRFSREPAASAETELGKRLAARDKTRDQLVVASGGGATVLTGALEELTAAGWRFRVGSRLLSGDASKAYAVVLAAGLGGASSINARLRTASGDDWPGRLVSADQRGVGFQIAGAAVAVPVEWRSVSRIDIVSDRVTFLSDVDPLEQEQEGFFGGQWPMRRDQSISGSPLRIAGRRYAKGVGVHSRSRLVYAVPAGFERFAADIGLDDGSAYREGQAVFRVRDGEKVLFDSGPIRGGDKARAVSLAVRGLSRITLEVDFGDGLDLGDHADWCNARFLR